MKNLKEYCRPSSVDEALQLKRELGDRAVYLAGGTDLLVHRPRRSERAIDIRYCGMNYVDQRGDCYAIGGGALLRDAEEALKGVCGGMLRSALRDTAPWLIRNVATVSGNIANASPAADSVPALMALDVQLRLAADESDTVPLDSIFVGPHCTTLGDRLIHELCISQEAADRQGAFIKLARSKSDIALVNVAVAFAREGNRVRDVRIALGAVAPTPMRARGAEQLLEGGIVTAEVLSQVEQSVRGEIRPISDWRASAEYRTRMSGVLVRRAIQQALARGRRGS